MADPDAATRGTAAREKRCGYYLTNVYDLALYRSWRSDPAIPRERMADYARMNTVSLRRHLRRARKQVRSG